MAAQIPKPRARVAVCGGTPFEPVSDRGSGDQLLGSTQSDFAARLTAVSGADFQLGWSAALRR